MTDEKGNWVSEIPVNVLVPKEKKYFSGDQVAVSVELLQTKYMPMLRIVLSSRDSERFGAGHLIDVHFCQFRYYDWCWSFAGQSDPKWDARKGDGFCRGLDVCNGGGYHLPLGYDIEAILRTTLAAAIQKMEADVEQRIRYEIPVACRGEFEQALRVALQVAGPAWKLILSFAVAHAIDEGNAYFGRLSQYRGGRSVSDNAVIAVAGFTPEDCWFHAEHGTKAVIVEGGAA